MNNDTSWGDTQKLLAFLLVLAFIVVIYLWMLHPPSSDPGTTSVLNTLVGTLGGMAGMVVTFYFGSSKGSKDKDDTMASIASHAAGNGTTQPPGTTTTTTTSAPPAAAESPPTTTTTTAAPAPPPAAPAT
jgi:hypothetical protein